jgi:EmrB/QacA subfamily drug resistance transporter
MSTFSALKPALRPSSGGSVVPLIGVLLALLISALDKAMATSAMPRAAADLNGFSRYSWTTTAHLLTATIAMLVFAKLSDLHGRKRLYLWSTLILVLGSLLCGAAGKLPLPLDGMSQLIMARAVLGMGDGAITALAFTFIADLFPPVERGRYQGVLSAVYGIGSVAGLTMGGWLTDHFSWRWAFWVNVPAGIMAIFFLYFTIPDYRQEANRRSIDWAGIAALCGWVVPLLVAFSIAGESNWSTPAARQLLIASAVVLLIFLFLEKHAVDPVLFLDLFKNRRIALASVNLFLQGVCAFSVVVFLPVCVQGGRGDSAALSGAVLSSMIVGIFVGNLAGGQFISRTARYRHTAVVGTALAMAGLLLLSRIEVATTTVNLFGDAFILGLGLGCLTPAYEVLVQNATNAERMGAATGATRFLYSMGSTIGPALLGSILLKAYHRHLDPAISSGVPAALRKLLDDPLKLFLRRPNLDYTIAQIPDGKELLANALKSAQEGLLSAVHAVFLVGAVAMLVSFALNMLLGGEELERRNRF